MKPDTLRKLSALGLSVEQIAGVLEIMDAEAEQGKEKARARWRKWKEGQDPNVSKRLQTTANVSQRLVRAEGSSSKTEITGQVEQEEAGKPRRVSKKEQDVSEFRAEFSPHLSPKALDELVKQRIARNATLTGYAGQLLLKAFSRCGLSPAEGADMCVERNWTTIKPDWIKPAGNRTAPASGKRTIAQAAADLLQEDNDERQSARREGDYGDVELLSSPGGIRSRYATPGLSYGRG